MNRVSRYRPRPRYGVSGLVASAAGAVGAAYRGYKRTRSGRRKESSETTASPAMPSSYQHDRRVLYRRRRPNKRRVRRVLRFNRRVERVLDSNLGNKMVAMSDSGVAAYATNENGVLAFTLSGGNSTSGFQDLKNVWLTVNVPGTPAYSDIADKLIVDRAIGNLYVCNVQPPIEGNSIQPLLYVTLYHWVTRRGMPGGDADPASKYQSSMENNLQNVGQNKPLIEFDDLLATPFMAGQWCQHFLVTKVQQVILQPGQETVLQIQDSKRHVVRNDEIDENACIRRVSRGVLVTFHGSLNGLGATIGGSMTWRWERTYYARHNISSSNCTSRW